MIRFLRFLKKMFSRRERLRLRYEEHLKDVDLSKCPVCIVCNELILPGDFVGRGSNGLVHAGFHDTAREKDAFCETGAIGIGYWDGEKIVDMRESAVAESTRTGDVVVRND